jgi:hypothetical protein
MVRHYGALKNVRSFRRVVEEIIWARNKNRSQQHTHTEIGDFIRHTISLPVVAIVTALPARTNNNNNIQTLIIKFVLKNE